MVAAGGRRARRDRLCTRGERPCVAPGRRRRGPRQRAERCRDPARRGRPTAGPPHELAPARPRAPPPRGGAGAGGDPLAGRSAAAGRPALGADRARLPAGDRGHPDPGRRCPAAGGRRSASPSSSPSSRPPPSSWSSCSWSARAGGWSRPRAGGAGDPRRRRRRHVGDHGRRPDAARASSRRTAGAWRWCCSSAPSRSPPAGVWAPPRCCPGASAVVDTSRFLVCAGLWLLCAAVLLDERPRTRRDDAAHRPAELGQLLPHVAMVAAVAVVGGVAVTGSSPGRIPVVGIVVSVALAAVHRWVTGRDERRMAALLRRSEAYFRSLVRSSGDAVVILDDALRITWASPGARTLPRVRGRRGSSAVRCSRRCTPRTSPRSPARCPPPPARSPRRPDRPAPPAAA